jgi:hypothetical protein
VEVARLEVSDLVGQDGGQLVIVELGVQVG